MATSQPPANPPDPTPDPTPGPPGGTGLAKLALRDQLSTARKRLPVTELGVCSRALAGHLLAAPEVAGAATVAAYVSIGSEPGTSWLLEGLARRGTRVLLPVLLPDDDLDWAVHGGEGSLAGGRLGLLEPAGERLGTDAIAGADAVLVPGLAVSRTGMRMGRGGGSYDRALARVPLGTFTCVLLYDGETDHDVPAEAHDRAVGAVATPSGLRRF
ncbi:MAG: 5-formyltetrahydrofolate cyclo-ligase [Nocardioides sp.]|uniref:5-formyltetrahydrofolate cyclo-ligase n=1 Tax=Nocardioides sp. TaxID=35761 RepID=UPI00238E4BBB|nr:5-formyltetrahydrofolate cyclo-ligase [Nocardioides sp.]MDE0775936.1 5-formyltetrahydrofolate cyclo-ligase [Nocardioides sp.]